MSKSKKTSKVSLILGLMILVSALFLANKWIGVSQDNRSRAATNEGKVILNESF